ncbi:MAG: Swt1 family HEPN domain-containing protein [Chloracidobacterium sp.]|nr:Swt1 family HEPN domain-containing protein [Chloracidobacterium sp.]MDW8218833.1 Swt1 family HEPN domain-containing protein [Acidobacteriota bacterium]
MAVTNQERVGKAMEALRAGLGPYVEREVQAAFQSGILHHDAVRRFLDDPLTGQKPIATWDAAALLKLMWEVWNDVFRRTLGFSERSLVSELRDWRNKWAHQEAFSSDDAYRVLDSAARLLTAVSAREADEIERMKLELLRARFDEQVRGEKRKVGGSLIEPAASGHLAPWREVVTPHPDVAGGRYQQAEFAADLWQVHLGEGTEEYRHPPEFFRRTYLTQSLKRLLVGAVERLAGRGGDPVIQLQTNFGGGKTHAMLALYHLFSGVRVGELPGVDAVLAEAGVAPPERVRRVVLVGNKLSPGNPVVKPDGVQVRTLWGELAYQLGGAEAYARIAPDDERATSPGDRLRELLSDYGPCLILIDEWVAYARQLHDADDLPGGSFETQFTFAQALTESVKLVGNCLLVVSLPASDTQGTAYAPADDVEVGGLRGREALERLRNVVGRVESAWRPATAEEGFEIVRRRLFEPLSGPEAYKQRDVTARAFADLYRAHAAEFPPECRSADYERRLQAAYPIHPEVFDRLYEDWSTLAGFQRTRGVLRLMAAVIHRLWESGDRSPLILPASIPIDDPRVRFELTRYLPDNWTPIIEKDVDGAGSLPMKLDRELPNLGKLQATRRVARAVYLGSAPTTAAAQRGLEDRRVKLGCVAPGESPAVFGDALRRLAAAATYLYQDGARVWYAPQPTVTKLAEERAEQLKRDPDQVAAELEKRLRAELRNTADFARVHLWPCSGADVPDELDVRLVVLPPEHPYGKEAGNAAERAAQAILDARGNTPRLYRNTLVFLAADRARLSDLDEAVRRYLAWASIIAEKDTLDLSPFQLRQAEAQRQAAEGAVAARLPETYQWLLVPEQKTPASPVTWTTARLSGADALAARAGKKLRYDELLVTSLGATMLRKHLDEIPLWRGEHVAVRRLIEDFAGYLYLPRLAGPRVLVQAVEKGVGLLSWEMETFAYAEGYDEAAGRYRGLRAGQVLTLGVDDGGLVVKPDAARRQLAQETPSPSASGQSVPGRADLVQSVPAAARVSDADALKPSVPPPLRRFYGAVRLDPARVGRDAGRIAEEVIAHLLGQPDAEVSVTLEIEARLPNGASEQVVRTVTENSRTLKFNQYAFETE